MDDHNVPFLRSEAAKLYGGVNPERWERIREQEFLAVAEEITGQRCVKNSFVRCPFHIDNTPSLKVYENDAYCFSCGLYYDAISLVTKYQDTGRFKALLWLEDFYKLPPMANVPIEEVIEDVERELRFTEVKDRYMKFAASDVQRHKNVELAEDYLRYYFEGKQEDSAVPLLVVLGPDIIAEISREHGLE